MPFTENRGYLHFIMHIDVLHSGTVSESVWNFWKKIFVASDGPKTKTVLL